MTEKERERKHRDNKKYYAKTANLYPPRRWTKEDIDMVVEHAIPDSELSKKLQRSVKSIQEKRRREKYKNAK